MVSLVYGEKKETDCGAGHYWTYMGRGRYSAEGSTMTSSKVSLAAGGRYIGAVCANHRHGTGMTSCSNIDIILDNSPKTSQNTNARAAAWPFRLFLWPLSAYQTAASATLHEPSVHFRPEMHGKWVW